MATHLGYRFSKLLGVLGVTMLCIGCNCGDPPAAEALANDTTPPFSIEFRVTWSDPNGSGLSSTSVMGTPASSPFRISVPSNEGFLVIVSARDNIGVKKILLDYTQFEADTQVTTAHSRDYSSCAMEKTSYYKWFEGGDSRSFNMKAYIYDFNNNRGSTASVRIEEVP